MMDVPLASASSTVIKGCISVGKDVYKRQLSSSHTGEREPKASWFLVVVGVLSLAWGYYTAVTVNDPLNALLLFFLAVLAVILGTFCLFTAGSIALLKWMKKRKNYYYTPEHFISVSGMMYLSLIHI